MDSLLNKPRLSYQEWQERQKTFKEYVLGFMFNKAGTIVCLIGKQKPEWQKDKLNGVGGKMKWDETAFEAMVREFKEETGVETDINKWEFFAKMVFDNDIMGGRANVYCFRIFSDDVLRCQTNTEEIVYTLATNAVLKGERGDIPSIPNVPALIALALNNDFGPVVLYGK